VSTHRPPRPRTMKGGFREQLSVFALAAFLLLAVVGIAFGAGYVLGKLLL
jgi:hypothetical protein